MSARRLLVLDAYDAAALRQIAGDGAAWDVLLPGRSEAWFRWDASGVPDAGPRLHYLDPHPLAPGAIERVRAFVLAEVAAVGDRPIDGRPLRTVLEDDLGTSWWYTETSEHGPYRTPLVFQLYHLALVAEAMSRRRYDAVVVATRHTWLADVCSSTPAAAPAVRVVALDRERRDDRSAASRYWRSAVRAVASVLIVRAAAAASAWRQAATPPGTLAVFSFYPAWWRNPVGEDAGERFFSEPPADAWFLCWLHDAPWIWRSRRAIGRVVERRRMVVLQRYVRLRDALALLSPLRFRRTMAVLARLAAGPRLHYGPFDVTAIVMRDVERSLVGGERFQDELLAGAVARAVERRAPGRIVYRAEFQPAERAVGHGAHGRAATAGFVHYPFGRNYLPVWARNQPRPDDMLTCGAVGRAHLLESGYPGERIACCGPQRHAALVKRLAMPRDRSALRRAFDVDDATPLLLVAPAIVEADTEALLASLQHALDGFGACRLAIRTHPNRPDGDAALERAVDRIGAQHPTVNANDVPLYDAIEASDALITIGSTLAFEAMALGCMPIVFENPSTYAATSLAAFGDALYVVHDEATLRSALDEVRSVAPGARRRAERWAETVQRMFGDLRTPVPLQLTRALDELDRTTLAPAHTMSFEPEAR